MASSAHGEAMSPLMIAERSAAALLVVAALVMIYLSIKFRRKQHLYWTVPLAIGWTLGLIASMGAYYANVLIVRGIPFRSLASGILLTLVLSEACKVFAVIALVSVLWKATNRERPVS